MKLLTVACFLSVFIIGKYTYMYKADCRNVQEMLANNCLERAYNLNARNKTGT